MARLARCSYRDCNDNEGGVCLFDGYCGNPQRYTEYFSDERYVREILNRAREERMKRIEENLKKKYGEEIVGSIL